MKALRFVYRNHREDVSERLVDPMNYAMFLAQQGEIKYYPQGGWMFSAFDLIKQAERTFKFDRIIGPITEVNITDEQHTA